MIILKHEVDGTSFAEDLAILIEYWLARGTSTSEIEQALADAVVPESQPKDEQDS